MSTPTPIRPTVDFDPMRTGEAVRDAFVRLAQDEAFRECSTMRGQVLFAKDFLDAEEFTRYRIRNADIARFFGFRSDSSVSAILRQRDNTHEVMGRTPALSPEHLEAIRGWIQASLRPLRPLTLQDVVVRI